MAADNSSGSSSSFCSNSSTNNCSSSGTSEILKLSPSYIAAVVIITVIVLLGVPANIAVIVKLGRHLPGSSMTQRLFFSLAVSDLLCLLCLTIDIIVFDTGYDLPHGVCRLVRYFSRSCITCDLNILVLISIQRYYQVLQPKKWEKVGQTWRTLLIFSVWMLGALITLPVVFLMEDVNDKDKHTYGHSCKNHRVAPVFEVVYVLFIAFSYSVLLFFYLLLVRGVRQTQTTNRKQPRVTKTLIRIITVALVVGFVPLIFRMTHMIAQSGGSEKLLHISEILRFVECLYFFNYCLNPFLYFFASKRGRTSGNKRGCVLMPLNDNS